MVRATLCIGALAALVLTGSDPARAGGFDSFLVHSARHLGVGGAAIGYVDDPSAVFHNPAGLTRSGGPALMLEAGIMRPSVRSSPAPETQATSEPMFAPNGMLGGLVPLGQRVALGVAAHPIAAAGARYRHDGPAGNTRDEMRAALVEVSPAAAVRVGHGVSIGVGYRVTAMSMRRESVAANADRPGISLDGRGVSAAGIRIGAQWDVLARPPDPRRLALSLGVAYRHRVSVPVHGEGGTAIGAPLRRFETSFLLPSRLGFGARLDHRRVGVMLDAGVAFDGQNDRRTIHLRLEDGRAAALPNVFAWRNSAFVRGGLELRVLASRALALRIGGAWDAPSVSRRYPTPFGPPPTDVGLATGGVGLRRGPWSVNAGYGFRFGGTRITRDDVAGAEACAFCGYPGRYEVRAHLVALDVSHTWRGGS